MTDNRLPPMVPGPVYPELNPIDEMITEALENGQDPLALEIPDEIMSTDDMAEPEEFNILKRLSAEWGQPGKRRKRLVARLKRHRTYNPPIKGGRRKRRFGK